MADCERSKNTDNRGGDKQPRCVRGGVSAVQRYFQQRRAKKQQEPAADRAARSTARATWAIALLTVVAIGVGISQYIIFTRQLDEMRATREGGNQSFADQIAVMRDQAKAMQGQMDQMAFAQRAWILVNGMSVTYMRQFAAGDGIVAFAKYNITNIGHSPASAMYVETALILRDIDDFDSNTVRQLCRQQPAEADRPLADYSDTVLPGQTQLIEGIGSAAEFRHPIEGLIEKRDAKIKAATDLLNKRLSESGLGDLQDNKPPFGQRRFAIAPVLSGCITYKTVSGEVHRTGFGFNAAKGGIFEIPVEVGRTGDIYDGPPLTITPSPIGNFAD